MAELKIKADSGGGTVSLKGPATTTSNAAVQLTLPVDDGTSGQYLKTDGSGALSWSTVSAGTALTGSTDNTVCTVTGADAIQGEANLKFDGTELTLAANRSNTAGTGHVSIAPGDTTSIWTIRHDSTGNDLWFDRGTDSSSTAYVGFSHDGNIKLTSGKGIDFSATADGGSGATTSELLADYEFGTYTPTVSIPTGTGTLGSNNCARYVKIGQVVHIYGYFLISWSEDAAGEITFGNLPYASVNETDGFHGGTCFAQGSHNTTTDLMKFCITNMVQNTATFKMRKQTDIDSSTRLTVADVNYEPNDATQFYSLNLNYIVP